MQHQIAIKHLREGRRVVLLAISPASAEIRPLGGGPVQLFQKGLDVTKLHSFPLNGWPRATDGLPGSLPTSRTVTS